MTLGAAILSYLSRRPIAPIVEKSNEKNNVRALQLMCIVDHHMGQRKMYDRFAGHPKMLTQLLQFHSFVSFKYYDYRANSKMFQKLMQCKFCELIGPCTLILTHMSMNHNTHIGLKTCIFCNRTDFADHLKTNTGLDDCYHEYKTKYNEIEELSKDHNLLNAIVDFYEMLNAISSRLNVCILRTHGFAGSGHKVTEKLQRNYGDDLDSECIVFNVRNTKHKQLDSSKLRKEFNDIVKTMRDNEITHFLSPRAIKSEDSIQIVDDDDIDLQPAQSGFENQLNQSGLENQSLQSDQLGSENQTLQSDQSGLDLSFVLEVKYSPPEEKQEDISQQGIENVSYGDLSGESIPEPPSERIESTSNGESKRERKAAKAFAKFIENQILETNANKRRKLKNDIIQLVSKYIEE